MSLVLDHISNEIIKDVSLTILPGKIVTIVGPTGAGKSTLLKIIAGLQKSCGGNIYLNNQEITFVPSHLRGIAMLFQNHILFPQKNVYENISFGLRRSYFSKEKIYAKVQDMANMFELSHLLQRYPDTLSGGERQRVALAQILSLSPKVLLLDEPLTHLDQPSQYTLRRQIQQIQQILLLPILYITHNQNEARSIGDQMGILIDGKLQQLDSPQKIYQNPANLEIATFLGIS